MLKKIKSVFYDFVYNHKTEHFSDFVGIIYHYDFHSHEVDDVRFTLSLNGKDKRGVATNRYVISIEPTIEEIEDELKEIEELDNQRGMILDSFQEACLKFYTAYKHERQKIRDKRGSTEVGFQFPPQTCPQVDPHSMSGWNDVTDH